MIHRSNGFDVLRLLAAAMVIFGHSYPLTGNVSQGFLANSVQTIGVKIFFVISGFLITKSWQSDPDLVRFWLKRALRIMPGLAFLCLLTVTIVGPIFTRLSLASYFSSHASLFYFWNILLYPVYSLPGVFQGNIYGPAVNGSLWSLPVEIAMYTGVPILVGRYVLVGKIATPFAAAILLLASILLVRIAPMAKPIVFWGSSLTSTLDAAFYFYAGAAIAVHRLDRFANLPLSIALFAVAAATVNNYIYGEIVLACVLPYAVIAIGITRIVPLQRMFEGRDYSYGLYLYGFVVQQAVVHLFGPLTPIQNTLIALPVALLCAIGSWHLVEQRALSFKRERSPTLSAPLTPGKPNFLSYLGRDNVS
jgi:peptidoglycan/LPS O-acetylase OafA/YrhL